ncbi:hypothetical protein HK102_007160, partial [Quaeritorhiza haematococci]
FGVDHTGGKGVFESWDDPENLVAVIRNTMHHPDHRVECVFSSDRAFQRCVECGWHNPFAGELMISQTKYPVLHQQYFNITINNTVNNYNNKETDVAWNEFKEDGLEIVSDSQTNNLLLAGLSGTNQRVAELAYHIYGSRFAIVPGGCWYHFNGVVWEQEKDRHEIKLCLKSDAFLGMFTDAKAAFANTANDVNDRKRKVAHIQNVINKLESAAFKNAVVDELGPLVASKTKKLKFLDKLDRNRDLIAFDNGVYDLEGMCFREARPDDFLTKTVGYDFDCVRHPEVEAKIHDFFHKVFPDPEVKEYVLKFLASCLAGHTSDQLFHFGHGDGSNGKGILNNLMALTLGEYAAPMNASFLCSKIKDADAPTPTLTKLVGCRFVYISGSFDGSKINEQTFKQLCGEDKLTFRPLHGEQVDFHPDFKLFMVCNSLPAFNGAEYSMRRRLRLIPFVSSFRSAREMSSSSGQHVFLINPKLNDEIKGWKTAFMHILLDYYQLYQAEGLEAPALMDSAKKEWIQDNDSVSQFIDDRCVFGDDERVHWSSLWAAYQSWTAGNSDLSGHFAKRKDFYASIKPMLEKDTRVITKVTKIEGYRCPGVEKMGLKSMVFT